MPDDPQILQLRLERARRRAADSPAFSPDWDAAMALIEDIERRLVAVADGGHEVEDRTRTVPVPI
jgi:hypothetical protein